MSVRPQILNPNYTLSQSSSGQMIMNQMGNNQQYYQQPQPQAQANNLPNGINSYDYNQNNYANYPMQQSTQINQAHNYNEVGMGIQPQYTDLNSMNINESNNNYTNNQNQVSSMPYNIPIDSNLIGSAINNPNSLIGGILDNIGERDDRKKKNTDEYKKLLLDQIEMKKCK